ncbi:hypothetical protein ACWENQ_40955 [Nonomuraea sp. NPDC004354]
MAFSIPAEQVNRPGFMTAGDSATLACPQCAFNYLHLDVIHVAGTVKGGYTPGPGLEINPHLATASGSDEATTLHAGQNRGEMVSIGYWCEQGCRGRIVLRQHKGQIFASLHNEPRGRSDGSEFTSEEEPS